jgi:hypothetical protein
MEIVRREGIDKDSDSAAASMPVDWTIDLRPPGQSSRALGPANERSSDLPCQDTSEDRAGDHLRENR